MGLFRKITSVSTLGVVSYRNPVERGARSARLTKNAIRAQTAQDRRLYRLQSMQQAQQHQQQIAHMTHIAIGPTAVPGWYADPHGQPCQRWWDGREWTPYTA